MNKWYEEYWAHTWYKTSYLVRRPEQIARVIGHNHEWNNICDSGCHFTCLAMIIGIDPARLASALSSQRFFYADSALPARHLTGGKGGLVWDQNAPSSRSKKVVLRRFWHSKLGRRTTVTIEFESKRKTTDYAEGKRIVKMARDSGLHVICGSQEHSYLVAGRKGGDYFVWDPDPEDSDRSVEYNLRGDVTLRYVFDADKEERIEFWKYRVDFA